MEPVEETDEPLLQLTIYTMNVAKPPVLDRNAEPSETAGSEVDESLAADE